MTLRHTRRFHFPPITRRSSSSCHWRACPRLSTSGSWAKCSTPSSRSQSYPINLLSIFLSSTRNTSVIGLCTVTHLMASACPGGGSGASRKAHRHAARAGRARDYPPPRVPRHGALNVSHGQPLALAHPRPVAPGAAATESHRGSAGSARLCRQCRVSRRLSGWPLRGLPQRAPLVRTICSALLLLPGFTLSHIVGSRTHSTSMRLAGSQRARTKFSLQLTARSTSASSSR